MNGVFYCACMVSSLNWEYIAAGFLPRCDLFSVLVEVDPGIPFVPNFLFHVADSCVLILFSFHSNLDMMDIAVSFISNAKQCKVDGS